MQIRPLRYLTIPDWDTPLESGEARRLLPIYGKHQYLTKNDRFAIRQRDGQWHIIGTNLPMEAHMAAESAGLYDIPFPRLRDAVEALEQVMEGIE